MCSEELTLTLKQQELTTETILAAITDRDWRRFIVLAAIRPARSPNSKPFYYK